MRIKTRPLGDAHLGCWRRQPALFAHCYCSPAKKGDSYCCSHCCYCSPATSILGRFLFYWISEFPILHVPKLVPLLLLLTCNWHKQKQEYERKFEFEFEEKDNHKYLMKLDKESLWDEETHKARVLYRSMGRKERKEEWGEKEKEGIFLFPPQFPALQLHCSHPGATWCHKNFSPSWVLKPDFMIRIHLSPSKMSSHIFSCLDFCGFKSPYWSCFPCLALKSSSSQARATSCWPFTTYPTQ